MAIPVTLAFTTPPTGYCPSGPYLANVVDYLNSNYNATGTEPAGSGVVHLRQVATPTPSPNTVWYRLAGTGPTQEPLGTYVYFNGRFVPEPPPIGTLRELSPFFDSRGLMDADGKGLFIPESPATNTPNIAGVLFGWHLCNGENGTPNLQSRFKLPAREWDETEGAWVARIKKDAPSNDYELKTNGGREGITILKEQLPPLPVRKYSAGANQSTNALYGGPEWDNATAVANVNVADGAQLAVQPVLPIWRAVPTFIFIGYAAASQD